MRTDTTDQQPRATADTATPESRPTVHLPVPRPGSHAGRAGLRHRRVLFLAPGHSPRLAPHLQARRPSQAA